MLFQLRCGILPLRIETGHYDPKPLPPEDRICLLWDRNSLFIPLQFVSSTETDILYFVNSIYPQFTNLDVPSKFDLIMNNPKVIKYTA